MPLGRGLYKMLTSDLITFLAHVSRSVTIFFRKCCRSKSIADQNLNNLSTKLREHSRNVMLSFLSSLPIPVLRILDIEANRFYDRNTKCMKLHF